MWKKKATCFVSVNLSRASVMIIIITGCSRIEATEPATTLSRCRGSEGSCLIVSQAIRAKRIELGPEAKRRERKDTGIALDRWYHVRNSSNRVFATRSTDNDSEVSRRNAVERLIIRQGRTGEDVCGGIWGSLCTDQFQNLWNTSRWKHRHGEDVLRNESLAGTVRASPLFTYQVSH